MNVNPRSFSNIFRGDGLKSGYPSSFLDKLLPGGSDGKESACSAGDPGSIPEMKDPLEKGMVTHSTILAWGIPWAEEPGGLQSMGLQRAGYHWTTTFTFLWLILRFGLPWWLVKNLPAMRETWVRSLSWEDPLAWQPTPAFLPGESPWTEKPGGLQSTGSQRVRHKWAAEN